MGSTVFDGCQVPTSRALKDAITSGDRKRVHVAEQAYLLRLLATPEGADYILLVAALNAHYLIHADPGRVVAHVEELAERGIVERVQDSGKFRVKPEAVETMRAITSKRLI